MEDKNIRDVLFTVLDVETTGIHASSCRVCEVALLNVINFEEKAALSHLINPQCKMPLSAQQVHGISDEMLEKAPAFSEVSPALLSLLENSVVVGHNVRFDIDFLNNELNRIGLKLPNLPIIDTLILARNSRLFEKNTLGAIAEKLHINNENWHRAMSDVKTTKELLFFFLKRFVGAGIYSFKEIHKLSGGKYVGK